MSPKTHLVGGLNPSEKYSSTGMIIPNIWKNTSHVPGKPPTTSGWSSHEIPWNQNPISFPMKDDDLNHSYVSLLEVIIQIVQVLWAQKLHALSPLRPPQGLPRFRRFVAAGEQRIVTWGRGGDLKVSIPVVHVLYIHISCMCVNLYIYI